MAYQEASRLQAPWSISKDVFYIRTLPHAREAFEDSATRENHTHQAAAEQLR